jgi:hypothetical protein
MPLLLAVQVGAVAVDARSPDSAGQYGMLWGGLQPDDQAVLSECITAVKTEAESLEMIGQAEWELRNCFWQSKNSHRRQR